MLCLMVRGRRGRRSGFGAIRCNVLIIQGAHGLWLAWGEAFQRKIQFMPKGMCLQGDGSGIVVPSFILHLVYLLFRFYLHFV